MEKIKVEFKIAGNDLYLKNLETGRGAIVTNQKDIMLFLNAQNLTSNDVHGTMQGYDALKVFRKKMLLLPM